jgi:hypothetical protein
VIEGIERETVAAQLSRVCPMELLAKGLTQ